MKLLSRKRYQQLLAAEAAAARLANGASMTRRILKAADQLLVERDEENAALRRTVASTEQALKQADEDVTEWSTAYKTQAATLQQTREALAAASADAAVALHGEITVHVLQRGNKVLAVRRTPQELRDLAHTTDPDVSPDPAHWGPRRDPLPETSFRLGSHTIPATRTSEATS
ncbi:hypothetical protein [Streptomyces sp. XH2]|uniref:hypothetical protein n=1 Tax=Streptomyces sp. XH2 TaxID=3412483 RepID=UPI003C7A78E3